MEEELNMATWYIHTSGNDTTGDGSSGNPWLTISKAHTSASSGDTIIVKDSSSSYTLAGQTFTKSLTIEGESTSPSLHTLDAASTSIRWNTSGASLTLTINYLTFTNGFNNQIFYAQGTGMNFLFTDCIFDLKISKTTVNALFAGGGTNANVTITNCIVKNMATQSGTGVKKVYSENGGYTTTFQMYGCTLYLPNDMTSVIGQVNTAPTSTVKNIICYAVASTPWKDSGGTANGTYSCFYNITSSPSGTGNITSDPLLVSPTSSNYNLRDNSDDVVSPCIDTGGV